MKYSARLMVALTVIVSVVATIVAAMVNTTTTVAKTVVHGVLTIGSSVTAGFVAPTGGVPFFHSSASTLSSWFASIIRATTRTLTATTRVSGAGRTTRTIMPMQTQHRHVAAVDTHYIDDGTTGFRRWLRWPTAKIADITARLQRTRHLPRLA